MDDKWYIREMDCEKAFRKLGTVYNANTPENHPLVFKTEIEYKDGISILGICARMFPDVKIYAFQIMSNHVHLVVGGEEDRIKTFFKYFVSRLEKYFRREVDFSDFELTLHVINDLAYFRNAVVYVNRNGSVVNNNVTPFSYPWGSSACFFTPVYERHYRLAGRPIGARRIRALMHSRYADQHGDLIDVDGFVSPIEFCDIHSAEATFRDARQYFNLISRDVESYAEIAKITGESFFYTDNDLYQAAVNIAKSAYGEHKLNLLPADAKIDIAKRLRYDYNAGDKQIRRLLKIDESILAF